jgi:hypothetical protein
MALMEPDKKVLGLVMDISRTPKKLRLRIKRRERVGLFMSR